MALFRSLFEWVQCFVHRIPRRRKKQGVQKWTEAEWTPIEGCRPLDVSNIDQKRYCKASKYLSDKGKEREEKGRKRKLKKEKKMVDERESGRKEEETKDPTSLRIEVKPRPTPPAAEIKTPADSSFIKSSVKEPLVTKRASRHLPPLATKTRPPSSEEEPFLVQGVLQHPALPAIEVKPLPGSSFIKSSVEEPPLSVANFAPKATETKHLHDSFVVDPEMLQKASQQLAQPAKESLAVPHEPTPKQVISSFASSKSPEEEPRMVQRTSPNLVPPAIKTLPLQSVAKPLMLQRTSRHFAPKPTGTKPLRGSFVLEPKMAQRAEVKPKLATSSLIPVDIESEEDESVEHTKRTIPSSESEKANHHQMLKAGVKQKALFEKVHPIVVDQSDDSEKKKCGDSKADALRKAKELDELLTRLFCVDYSHAPKTESQQNLKLKNQQTLEAGVKQKVKFEKIHPIFVDQSDDSEKNNCGDSKADALRKAKELDELLTRLFCVDYNTGPKKENQQPSREGQEEPKNKGKTRAGPFRWAEKKLKCLNEERKESEKDEETRKALHEEFLRDPKSQFNTQPYL